MVIPVDLPVVEAPPETASLDDDPVDDGATASVRVTRLPETRLVAVVNVAREAWEVTAGGEVEIAVAVVATDDELVLAEEVEDDELELELEEELEELELELAAVVETEVLDELDAEVDDEEVDSAVLALVVAEEAVVELAATTEFDTEVGSLPTP